MTDRHTATLDLDWFPGRKTLWSSGECVTGKRTGAYKGKTPTGRSRSRWEDYIKMGIKDLGLEDVVWIDLAEFMNKLQAVVQVVMNILVP